MTLPDRLDTVYMSVKRIMSCAPARIVVSLLRFPTFVTDQSDTDLFC